MEALRPRLAVAPWTPDSWRSKPASQQPNYPDAEAFRRAQSQLSRLPPLVTSWEIETLKSQLADAAVGKAFLLQGGDCAETFNDCEPGIITNKLKILLQMSLVLVFGAKRRVIRVGRIAGQYTKPRSSDLETRDGEELPSYRGDLVNHIGFSRDERVPDPELMLRGYERAALTLNFIRSLVDGGFADLHHPEYWDLGFIDHSPLAVEYTQLVAEIGESIRFMETLTQTGIGDMSRVDFFTSHEGLHLPYEEAQTRRVPRRTGWYNLASHLPWIGMRTNDPDGAHVEYFRGIENPVAVKVGSGTSREKIARLIDLLLPEEQPGRLTLIHRFGASQIGEELPRLIENVRACGRTVVFCCDPMHGNTVTTSSGLKTRRFDHILAELVQAIEIHQAAGGDLGGVHFELTGENVTECVGGARGLREIDLSNDYRSQVDPRLNYEQALELAMAIARRLNPRG